MHFQGQALPTEKRQILSVFFDSKKSPVRSKTSRISKFVKNPSTKTAKFQNLQKRKILNTALGVRYSGCSTVPSATS